MIKYSESELADLLPSSMKENTDVQAISYAIKMATKKLIVYAGRAMLSGGIEQVPEDILDLMALELRTQYYDESLSIETKRNLIKNTMTWHERAGTPSAVEELIKIVFGVGEVVEWFDFDPNDGKVTPGQFDIETNATMTCLLYTSIVPEALSVYVREFRLSERLLTSAPLQRIIGITRRMNVIVSIPIQLCPPRRVVLGYRLLGGLVRNV